jgi:hypothetical protein
MTLGNYNIFAFFNAKMPTIVIYFAAGAYASYSIKECTEESNSC